jgi:glutamate/tyrosine decarboxylase-like PLP-dependent enzyme
VLDASVSPSRALFLAYVGCSGLEVGVLASVLATTYDANLATSAGGADLVDEQTLRWVAEFVGFPLGEGVFTSGGMTSNLTALLAAHGVWLHVDGAYGAAAAGVASVQDLFAGLSRADSVTIDADKWFGAQKPCSAVLLREPGRLRAAFGHHERYRLHDGDTANPVDRTLEYSRPLNSLR